MMTINEKFVRRTGVLLAVLLGHLTVATAGPTLGANQIVERVQTHYTKVKDYKARFVQTTAHSMFPGKYQRAYGNVMFKDGGLMRWEYKRPQQKLFVYDGTLLWAYEPEVPQVFKGQGDTDRLKKALAFLTGAGRIRDYYTAKKVNAKKFKFDGYVLLLTPKEKNSSFRHVELYVNKTNFTVERSVVVDHDNNRNRLDFYGVQTNTGLDPRMFRFAPPAGVPVITP